MNCLEAAARIPLYPGPSLTPVERADLMLHTTACAACRADLVAAVVMAEGVRELVAAEPGPPQGLRRAVLAAAAPEAAWRGVVRRALPVAGRMVLEPERALPPWVRRLARA